MLLCGDDEDVEVVKAASGGLAMLTAQSKKCCEKVFDVSLIFTYSYNSRSSCTSGVSCYLKNYALAHFNCLHFRVFNGWNAYSIY